MQHKAFPKASRLLKRPDFRRVSQSGKKRFGISLVIDYRFGRKQTPRLGITVSRKYGKAHLRNQFKRIIRESFRLHRSALPACLEINVRPKKGYQDGGFKDLAREMQDLLKWEIDGIKS